MPIDSTKWLRTGTLRAGGSRRWEKSLDGLADRLREAGFKVVDWDVTDVSVTGTKAGYQVDVHFVTPNRYVVISENGGYLSDCMDAEWAIHVLITNGRGYPAEAFLAGFEGMDILSEVLLTLANLVRSSPLLLTLGTPRLTAGLPALPNDVTVVEEPVKPSGNHDASRPSRTGKALLIDVN